MIEERVRKEEEYKLLINKIFAELNCNRLGIIESFDNITQTANISLVDLPYKNDEIFTKKTFFKVPLMTNTTQDGGLTIPIQTGDLCTLHIDDRDKDDYFTTGEIRKPHTTRKHNLNDCYFTILAPRPKNKTLQEYLQDAVKLYYKTTYLKLENTKATLQVNDNCLLKLENIETVLKTNSNSLTLSNVETGLKSGNAIVGINNGKIDLSNTITNLKTVLQTLILTLKTAQFVDNPASPTIVTQPNNTVIAQLTQIEILINNLLK